MSNRLKVLVFTGRTKVAEFEYELGDYIGRADAAMLAQTSDTTLRRWISSGQFPEPVLMMDGTHGFLLDDVLEWLSDRPC